MEKPEYEPTKCKRPPDGVVFRVLGVKKVTLPHPYMIGTRHVAYASDRCGGMLSESAIRGAELEGARCGWRDCNLKHDEHETMTTMFIKVPQNKHLDTVPGLHAYLKSIKEAATKEGIQGFAFPT